MFDDALLVAVASTSVSWPPHYSPIGRPSIDPVLMIRMLIVGYAYMPSPLKEPYLSRRRRVGFELYRLYGVARDDLEGRKLRNFEFFGAPVGLFFAMERCLLLGSWLDCGMFMQNVMILARAHGLETCPQQAWCEYGPVVHRELSIPADEIILSGMALGYADPDAPENILVSERVAPEEFAAFHFR